MLHLAALLAVALADTGAVPPALDWPVVQYGADGTSCKEVLPDSARTLLGIRLALKTLEAFERVLGASPPHKEGDAGEYFEWRCWGAASGDGADPARAAAVLAKMHSSPPGAPSSAGSFLTTRPGCSRFSDAPTPSRSCSRPRQAGGGHQVGCQHYRRDVGGHQPA